MHLVQILLPLFDNQGNRLASGEYQRVAAELTERFGGLTAFTRAPAEGLWESEGEVDRDAIVIFEVMADSLDAGWWRGYRAELERRFEQDEVVVRASEVERL